MIYQPDGCRGSRRDRSQARPSVGCVSKRVSLSGNATQGWALRVQKCAVGRTQEVSSSVPVRTATKVPGGAVPGLAPLQSHVPHSAQTHRVTVRPLSAVRPKEGGSHPPKRPAPAATTMADEKGPPGVRWEAGRGQGGGSPHGGGGSSGGCAPPH